MKRTAQCQHCGKTIGITLDKCPKCRGINFDQPENYKNMTMLSLWKEIVLFITGWKIISVISTIVQYILIFKNNLTKETYESFFRQTSVSMGINATVYLILFIILLAIINIDIPLLFKKFNSWKPYVAGLVCFFAMIAFNNVWSIIANAIRPITSNNNETSIRSIEEVYPLLSLIIFGFVGPICEELTYRVGLFTGLSKVSKYLAYPLVGLIFAFIHFDFDAADIINELLNIPTYIFAGIAFSFVYDKWGFGASLSAHVTNNVLAIILTTNCAVIKLL